MDNDRQIEVWRKRRQEPLAIASEVVPYAGMVQSCMEETILVHVPVTITGQMYIEHVWAYLSRIIWHLLNTPRSNLRSTTGCS